MALLGLVILLVVLIPVLVACALAVAAFATLGCQLLETVRAARERRAVRQAPVEPATPVRATTEPSVALEPVP